MRRTYTAALRHVRERQTRGGAWALTDKSLMRSLTLLKNLAGMGCRRLVVFVTDCGTVSDLC